MNLCNQHLVISGQQSIPKILNHMNTSLPQSLPPPLPQHPTTNTTTTTTTTTTISTTTIPDGLSMVERFVQGNQFEEDGAQTRKQVVKIWYHSEAFASNMLSCDYLMIKQDFYFQAACLPPYVILCVRACVVSKFLVQGMTTTRKWSH